MILYHAVTINQLLQCIFYKELFHKEQVCYLLLSDIINETYPIQMDDLFFEKIFIGNMNEFDSHEGIEKYLKANMIQPKEFSEIMIASTNSGLGSYLNAKEINFTYLEECYEQEDTNFELNNLIENIVKNDHSFQDKVLSFFGIDQKVELDQDSTILITQLFSDLISYEEQKKSHQLMVDYFVPESTRLVIQPHPDDLRFYNELFPQAIVLNKQFPPELLPFIFNQKPQTVLTMTSTCLKHYINEVMFSDGFERHFDCTHRYYCVVKLLTELHTDHRIYEMNADKLLLENFLKFSGGQFSESINSVNQLSEIPAKSLVIIDDFNYELLPNSKDVCRFLKSIDNDSIIIFINSNKEYLFYDYPDKELFKSMVPVEIHHNSTVDESNHYSETFFVYSKRKDTRKMVNHQEFEKPLRNSKEIINVKKLSEDQLRIKILEGILEATEKRLEHYIKLESELREKLFLRKTQK